MKALDSSLLKKLIKNAGSRLKGDWLLVGGTLLPAVGLNVRSTIDVDLIGLGASEASQNLELMEVAESVGLSVDTINQAAAFFLKKVGYTKQDLIVLYRGPSSVIYRPSVELYWRLKLGRLSESDFIDCQHYLQYAIGQNDIIDKKKMLSQVRTAVGDLRSFPASERAKQLEALLVESLS